MNPDVFQSYFLNACFALAARTDHSSRRFRLGCLWVRRLSLVVLLTGALLSTWILDGEARYSKRAQSSRSRQSSGRTSVRGRSGRASAATRSVSSARSGRGRRSRSSRSGSSAKKSRHAKAVSAPVHQGPTAAQIKRQETSGANDLEKRTDLERSYRAYDQGLSEWLSGNYSQAAKSLNEAYELYSDFHGAHDVLDSLYLYDLGQAAEAAGDMSLAKNSYQRSLRRRPDFSDCCIRLTALLTKNGETALALVYARRLADKNPQDPRAQFLLATMLERAGFAEEGKTARENFNLLMKGGSVNKPQTQVEPDNSPDPPSKGTDENPEQSKDDTESGVLKKETSSEKESGAVGGELKKVEP